ncbi:hypothetical protein CCACVL1_11519 [Corchorus capsularis]|uniref:Uncharacterized protein n=1 Tax=Corchorus capsularis TaxID=210143 RepID=A0A1R3IKS5_COCAP|nr:hypothetical protein CCACVL1_11519 [Corchorus capsularis]
MGSVGTLTVGINTAKQRHRYSSKAGGKVTSG